ncbi:MAG TPA: hypothetical protein VGN18_14070 [Jatrophihabitans sp.]|jgi:hypothetical protein|uniref:hypothetical protein n=1 Tax=Jatrophihabitans sp. TaxID=1932789 RepID=UPI002E068E79|nr:hypothetical protein [Jatrophihabitans sp.]
MRLVRIAVVTALAASTLAVPAVAQASAAPPYDVFTMSRSVTGTNTGAMTLDGATATMPTELGTPSSGIHFTATAKTGVHSGTVYDAVITPPTGGAIQTGSYSTTLAATGSSPGFGITVGTTTCSAATGTLDITELDATAPDQQITGFAADYTLTCAGSTAVTGALRFASTRSYSALDSSPAGWDFGWQTTNTDGTPKTFTITNRGSLDVRIDSEAFTGGTADSFKITADTCLNTLVANGASCQVTVTPHPVAAISSTNPGTLRVLHLTEDSGDPIDIPIRVEGRPYPTTYVQPGPGRITVNWGLLPSPIGSSVAGSYLYRGTIGQPVAYYKWISQASRSYTDVAVKTGQPYYYQVRPRFVDTTAGDLTPRAVAATAWPVYSAGMYHRLSTSQRVLKSRTIVAGHPYTLQVTGTPGIPATGVSAVALEITAANPTSTTAVTVYPAGTARPVAPDLTVTQRSARTNFVLARIGAGGRIVLSTSSGSTPVSVDVFGFYSAAGLSTAYGQGGAMHTYLNQGTIMDTKAFGLKALPKGYYLDIPVDFDPSDTPHVSSLLVEVTAYGSTGGGTLTAYPTNHAAPATSVMTYAGGRVTTNVSLVAAGRFVDSSTGYAYPSVTVLNRGSTAVHLIVTILGFVDDNTFSYGERYTPGSAVHLLSTTLYTGWSRTVAPSTSVAGRYTTALNAKLLVGNPAVTTAEALWPGNVPHVGAPSRPQVRANAHETTLGSTPAPLGNGNLLDVRNTSGRARLDLWSFGRFDFYPQPTSPKSFLAVAAPRPGRLAPAAAPVSTHVLRLG